MANEIEMRFTGALGADPEARQVGEKRMVSMRLVHSARVKRGDQWGDSAPWWFDASLWERWAGDRRVENVMESLRKGDRVDVVGVARAEAYTTRDGREGVSYRLQINSIAPSLEYATAAPVKNERREASGGSGWSGGGSQAPGQGWNQPQGQQGWGQPAGGAPSTAPAAQGEPAADDGAGWGQVFE